MAETSYWMGLAVAAVLTGVGAAEVRADSCRLRSPGHRVTVLELYTSEGCSSCPPADRWLSSLPQRGVSADKAILLAFHVDYWNRLGWPDRFSQPRFSERQREVAARASDNVVYTPQIVLDGRALGLMYSFDAIARRLAEINREKGLASISADVVTAGDEVRVSGEVEVAAVPARRDAQIWIALFEQGLSSRVSAGENAGRSLYHDFVVRELAGPFQVGPDGRGRIEHSIRLRSDWNAQRTGLAIFVQRRDDGSTLQATASHPLCGSRGSPR